MSIAERESRARKAVMEAGVIAHEVIELVQRHPERAALIVAEAQRLIARRQAGA